VGAKAFLSRNRWVLSGVALGLLYGLAMRTAVRFHIWDNGIAVMTWGFVFGVPLVIGFLTVFVAEHERRLPVWKWFLLPGAPLLALFEKACPERSRRVACRPRREFHPLNFFSSHFSRTTITDLHQIQCEDFLDSA
jgi:hypothetical protein